MNYTIIIWIIIQIKKFYLKTRFINQKNIKQMW